MLSKSNPLVSSLFYLVGSLIQSINQVNSQHSTTDTHRKLVSKILVCIMNIKFQNLKDTHMSFTVLHKDLLQLHKLLVTQANRHLFQTIDSIFCKIQKAYSLVDISQFHNIDSEYESFYTSLNCYEDCDIMKSSYAKLQVEKTQRELSRALQQASLWAQDILDPVHRQLASAAKRSQEALTDQKTASEAIQRQREELQAIQQAMENIQLTVSNNLASLNDKTELLWEKYNAIPKEPFSISEIDMGKQVEQLNQILSDQTEMNRKADEALQSDEKFVIRYDKLLEMAEFFEDDAAKRFDCAIDEIKAGLQRLRSENNALEELYHQNAMLEIKINGQRHEIEYNYDKISQLKVQLACLIKRIS